MNIILHATTLADTAAPPTIERSTGQHFLLVPELAWIAEDQTSSAAQYQAFITTDMSWLTQVNALPVGFLIAGTLGSSLFIAELPLHLEW